MRFEALKVITYCLLVSGATGGSYKRKSKSDLCNISFSSNKCFDFSTTNCTRSEINTWENLPYCNEKSCEIPSIHLAAYENIIHWNNATRNALNVSISKPMAELVWLMYEDVRKPTQSKCFTWKISPNFDDCADNTGISFDCYIKDSKQESLMVRDSITRIRSIANGRKNEFFFKNLYGKCFY